LADIGVHFAHWTKVIVVWMSRVLMMLRPPSREPTCPICNEPVSLRNAATDEDGKATHEECYVAKLIEKNAAVLPKKSPKSED
jgi:hypothetical protein